MFIDRALRIIVRGGFSCMQIQTNMTDTGFKVGSIARDIDDVESRFLAIVPDTLARSMVVGKGSLDVLLEKLARRIKRGTICNIPLIPVRDKQQAWRVLELNKLYLFLDEGVDRKDFPILSQRMEGLNDTEDEDSEIEDNTKYAEAKIEQPSDT